MSTKDDGAATSIRPQERVRLRKKNSISRQEKGRVSSLLSGCVPARLGNVAASGARCRVRFLCSRGIRRGGGQCPKCTTVEIVRTAATRPAQRGIFECSRHRS